ncbi:MAG: hypothetical protein AB1644_07980 [Candidatus Zixiibacteriota bacterium]
MNPVTGIPNRVAAVFLLGVLSLTASSVRAQTLELEVKSVDDHILLSKPVSISLSPSGGAFAVADQHGNRLFVFDTQGHVIWTIGENLTLERPTAVCLTNDTELLFSLKDKLQILKASSRDLLSIDTVADLSAYQDKLGAIDQLLTTSRGDHVVLDAAKDQIVMFDSDWKRMRLLLAHGQGRGRVWSPTGLALDPSGHVMISDSRNFPMQAVSSDGSVLFSAGWSRPGGERSWEASCVGIDRQSIIWAADWRESQWRLFDRTGNEIEKRPFTGGLLHPVGVAFTANDRMIVVEERGTLLLYSLP